LRLFIVQAESASIGWKRDLPSIDAIASGRIFFKERVMNQQQNAVDGVHKQIIERYPLYVTNGGFEQWLWRKAGADERKIHQYLDLLDDYGYMNGDGTLANDYANMPEPEHVTGEIRDRLERLGEEVLEALRHASIEGERFCQSTVTTLSGRDGSMVDGLLRQAVEAGVVTRDGSEPLYSSICDRYRFLPLQTRDILYEQIPDEERIRMHKAFIDFLGSELDRVEDPGAREMLNEMISEHNRRVARPEPAPSKP
jgi:hypothetical protein